MKVFIAILVAAVLAGWLLTAMLFLFLNKRNKKSKKIIQKNDVSGLLKEVNKKLYSL